MPLTLAIGLSRKVSKDYNSRGYSVNLDVELPADAVHDQQSIVEAADRLFLLCDRLLEDQIAGHEGQPVSSPPEPRRVATRSTQTPKRAAPTTTPKRGGRGPRLLTVAQGRAITNMARKLGGDANDWSRHEFGEEVERLNVRQASELIDLLKKEIESGQEVNG